MSVSTNPQQINELLTRGVEELIIKEDLQKKLESGKKLRIKFGIDPTGSELHIGHAVPLRKLRQFQDAGHQVILLIGDYTAMVGDPSGRDETRPMLGENDIKENMKTYLEQAAKILDIGNVEVRYNSEWFKEKGWGFVMQLTGMITVARILERDDFKKRLSNGSDIQMQEILYPLMQGYDSVALESDVEIGGTDQKFNLLMGRRLQKKYKQKPQDIVTIPLLEGTDGKKKMSKTYKNYIGLNDTAEDMYGKTMSIPDDLIIKYFELATSVSTEEIEKIKEELENGKNPRDTKMLLAYALTAEYHGESGAKKGADHFNQVIQSKGKPEEIKELSPSATDIITVLLEAEFVKSKSDARRAIDQGGVKINDKKVEAIDQQVKQGDIIQKGKRFFVKIS